MPLEHAKWPMNLMNSLHQSLFFDYHGPIYSESGGGGNRRIRRRRAEGNQRRQLKGELLERKQINKKRERIRYNRASHRTEQREEMLAADRERRRVSNYSEGEVEREVRCIDHRDRICVDYGQRSEASGT